MDDASFLTIRSAADLHASGPAPQPFILEPIPAPGTVGLVYGQPGVGKSFLALSLALAAAGGSSVLGWTAPRPHNVLYLDGAMCPDLTSSTGTSPYFCPDAASGSDALVFNRTLELRDTWAKLQV